MKHGLVPAAHVLLVLLVGTMPIPRGYAQPLQDALQEPSDGAQGVPLQTPQQASDGGALGKDRDAHMSKDNTATTFSESQVRLLLPLSPDNSKRKMTKVASLFRTVHSNGCTESWHVLLCKV